MSARRNQPRRGLSLVEVCALAAVLAVLVATVLPAVAQVRLRSGLEVSMDNLRALGAAHIVYAGDWNDRQYTNIVDEMSVYGDYVGLALPNYFDKHGPCSAGTRENCPPSIILGFDCEGNGPWGYWTWGPLPNFMLTEPISFEFVTENGGDVGAYRWPSSQAFNQYVGGRVYDPTFFAPRDTVPYGLAQPAFSQPCEFNPDVGVDQVVVSSYCFSPAAMFHPDVFRRPSRGGWQDPWLIDYGFRSPTFSTVKYPTLKTHLMEHHWLQNAPPAPCNPLMEGFWYGDCQPYLFSHGLDSAPATLFFDMSVRLLPNREAQASDRRIRDQTGGVDGLWSRDTVLGADGYFLQYAADPEVDVSHHILTTDGILGRDTLDGVSIR